MDIEFNGKRRSDNLIRCGCSPSHVSRHGEIVVMNRLKIVREVALWSLLRAWCEWQSRPPYIRLAQGKSDDVQVGPDLVSIGDRHNKLRVKMSPV